jgi:hypothetical protein
MKFVFLDQTGYIWLRIGSMKNDDYEISGSTATYISLSRHTRATIIVQRTLCT